MYSQKEMVKAQREAYERGAKEARLRFADDGLVGYYKVEHYKAESAAEAEAFYPMPKVRRPRTVVIESGVMRFKREVQWDAETQRFAITFHNGMKATTATRYQVLIQCAVDGSDSETYLALLDDLQKNPTELVDADEIED